MKLNQKGFSLLLTLTLAAVGAGVVVIMASRLTSLSSNQRTTTLKANYIGFVANLRAILRDPHTCELALRNQALGGNAINSVNNNLIIGQNQPQLFTNGPITNGWISPTRDFAISRVRLITMSNGPVRALYLDKPGPNLLSYRARINFMMNDVANVNTSLNSTDPNFRFPEYHIDIIVNIDSSNGRIYSCHGTNSLAEACEIAGGAYDGSTAMNATPQFRCHPYQRCWVDPGGVRTTNAPPLPAAANPPACPWPYTSPSWLGRLGANDMWICQWCNNRLWNPGVN